MEKDRRDTAAMTMVQRKLAWWTGGVFAGLAVIYAFPPAEHTFYPRCPLYAGTHLLCPGCGGTRALHEMLHLNLSGALHFNALATVVAPWVLLWLGWCCYQGLRYDRLPAVPWPRTIALILGLVSVFFAVARNAGAGLTI
jgi:hypothetical protein